jgi:hypothetical protein
VWALVFPAFYAFYGHTHKGWWWLRFLLPAFPPLIVAALLVARALAARFQFPRRSWWGVAAAAGIIAYGVVWTHHLTAHHAGFSEQVYPRTAEWLEQNVPADAVVASMQTSGALLYSTRFTFFRWDMIAPADFARIAETCTAAGRPVYAVLFPYEIEDKNWAAFDKHLTGRWVQIGAVRHVSIWRYAPLPADR